MEVNEYFFSQINVIGWGGALIYTCAQQTQVDISFRLRHLGNFTQGIKRAL